MLMAIMFIFSNNDVSAHDEFILIQALLLTDVT